MLKLRGLVLKDGKLERVPSLTPAERISFLVNANEEVHLTPVPLSYFAMGFPRGVFIRAYEELHYLDMILCRAAAEHFSKELMRKPHISEFTSGHSVLDEIEAQQKRHDEMMRGALGNTVFEAYQQQHSVLDRTFGSGNYVLDEINRQNEEFKKQHEWEAINSVQNEIERLHAETGNTLGSSTIGSAFQEMERLRADAEDNLRLGTVGSALKEMERQHQELVNGNTTRDALLGYSVQDALETHQAPILEPTFKATLPIPIDTHPFRYLEEENKRLAEEREKQRLRDEHQERQAKNSDALLKAQIENDQKAEEDRQFSKRMQVIGLIIAAIGSVGSFISLL
jgi:hypothetical protein